jgi:hypothetical protein
MDTNLLILGGIAILAVLIIVSIVKKAIKLVLFIGAIIVVISLYNVLVNGVSPMEEFNAYRTNIKYSRDIAQYTVKIKASTDNIKDIIESRKFDEASIKTLKEENSRLLQYQSEVQALNHTKKLNFFHDSYCSYLNTVISASDSTVKLATAGGKASQGVEDILGKLRASVDNLSNLKVK